MARIREAIGLDIGTSGVRAAHVSFARRPPTLENFGQISLPVGAIRDGEIADDETVAQAISQLWKRGGFSSKKVGLGIANQKVVIRQVDLPFMEEEELRGAIQYQVQEYIPIPVEDAVLDFQILDAFVTDTNERMMRVLLVAAQKDMVTRFVQTVQRGGLDPEAVDVIPLALIRSLGEEGGFDRVAGEGEAIIDLGAGITNIVVHERGIPRFVRILLIGGNALTEAIGASLGLSFEEAEGTKQALVMEGPEAVPSGQAAARILEERTHAFVDEIRGSLDYYMAQADATRIARLILTGGGSKLSDLPARLANATRLPVEQAGTLERLQLGRRLRLTEDQLAEAEPLMAGAVGLALGAAEE
ncbi:MAG: type IV pilus assembly protein PilM [Actinomycetota bacterium]